MSSILVFGGAGQLGGTVLKVAKSRSYKTISIDFRNNPDADFNIDAPKLDDAALDAAVAQIRAAAPEGVCSTHSRVLR